MFWASSAIGAEIKWTVTAKESGKLKSLVAGPGVVPVYGFTKFACMVTEKTDAIAGVETRMFSCMAKDKSFQTSIALGCHKTPDGQFAGIEHSTEMLVSEGVGSPLILFSFECGPK